MKQAFTGGGGSPTLLIFGLKNAGSDDWEEVTKHHHSGAIGIKELAGLTDEQLAAFDSVLEALPSPSADGGGEQEDSKG